MYLAEVPYRYKTVAPSLASGHVTSINEMPAPDAVWCVY